ncbi:MAG: mannitol system component [Actinomycetota bacterium]|jgi:PTS system mannitol-specific IIA component|nr:mannitol transporter subunit [Glaciihabitans sp.]MDQ1528407.1 mannitol system component [Actinomycetota bacterium]MDQ1544790.1 mannitol system component [Actinomycetota bacterium]MDQ1561122.1 mannitol system component [Actinomycetota bacterium]MDQ1573516.1 mannitol system component [Actinomycetota bacterium]
MSVLELPQINLHGTATTSSEAVDEAGRILVATGAVTADYPRYMHERENLVSTYMGNFLAIPHGTNDGKDTVLASALSFVRYDNPIDWGGNPVRFVVGIAGKDGGHMEVLSSIALIFSDEEQVDRLLVAETPEEVFALLGDVNE